MFKHRPRPDTLTQTLTVSRPPSAKLLSRVMQRFTGRWMLSSFGWVVVQRGDHYFYKLDLTWRSDISQYQKVCSDLEGLKQYLAYANISRTDRLRLWLLTVESAVRRLMRRDR